MRELPSILCAIDATDRSQRPVEASRWLAQHLGVSVVLAHVFDAMSIPVPSAKELAIASLTSEDIVRVERRRVRRRLTDAADMLGGVAHVVEFDEGLPVPGVLRLTREHAARLLVTGTAARGPLERILIGSVSSELAVKAPCPVVAVHSDADLDQHGPVLAAYDGSDHSLRAARHAAAVAARLSRDLVLMHVVEPGDAHVQPDVDLARELNAAARVCVADVPGGRALSLTVSVAVEEGDPVEHLARAARDRAAPLIFAGTRGRDAVSAALLGSISAGLVRSAGRPVALVAPTADAVLPTSSAGSW